MTLAKNSSLKSIAAKAGVSMTTVHRALTGKKDCSVAMREKILSIAAEEGYEVNFYAASLRRKKLSIAIVVSSRDDDSKYFVDKMIGGINRCIADNSQFNIDFRFFSYTSYADRTSDFKAVLPSLKGKQFDGILLHTLKLSQKDIDELTEILEGDVSAVAMELNPTACGKVCTISADNEVAGRMAGEIIAKLTRRSGKVYIFSQDMNRADSNATEARKEIILRRNDLDVVEIPLPLTGGPEIYEEIKRYVRQHPAAVYATCARHTARVIRAIGRSRWVSTVIGSELFSESYEALQNGTVDAIIDKRPEQIGYKALEMLLSHLIRKEPMEQDCQIEPRLVLKANSVSRGNYLS